MDEPVIEVGKSQEYLHRVGQLQTLTISTESIATWS